MGRRKAPPDDRLREAIHGTARHKAGLLRRGVYHRAGRRPDPLAPRKDGRAHGSRPKKFQTGKNLFPETGPKTSRSSGQRRRGLILQRSPASLLILIAGGLPPVTQSSGDDPCPSVLHCCPPS